MEQQKLNPVIVYVLAIIGFLCCCIGGIGFIFAGVAFFIAQSKLKEAAQNPEDYDPSSVSAMNTAKIIALVILIINVLYLLFTIYRIYTIGWDELMQQSQEMMEEWQRQNG
ncbi:CCC motif membrane protein [uncultured Psychroserpens sp.]|uniref:CCC motif membrane protein n=1 Tax=uncultured Psychroserpens sp. TaxID=255436 RepID=UPI00261492AC|nr:CCC motif membrane protein [uncultured Psychroserpens sp.]